MAVWVKVTLNLWACLNWLTLEAKYFRKQQGLLIKTVIARVVEEDDHTNPIKSSTSMRTMQPLTVSHYLAPGPLMGELFGTNRSRAKEKLLAPSPDQSPRQFGLVSFGQQSTWVKENSITNQGRQGPSVWKDSLSSGGNANDTCNSKC